jgi:hypothetical protein
MNSRIKPVRLVSGADAACPVHPPGSHGRASAAIGLTQSPHWREAAAALPRWGSRRLLLQADDARPGVDAGQQLGGLGRAFLLVGVAALCVRGSKGAIPPHGGVAQPTQAGRSTPLRACPVSGQVSARALVASSAARMVRRVLRAGGCSGWPAAGRPRTFRHTRGSVRLDAGWVRTRVAQPRGR